MTIVIWRDSITHSHHEQKHRMVHEDSSLFVGHRCISWICIFPGGTAAQYECDNSCRNHPVHS